MVWNCAHMRTSGMWRNGSGSRRSSLLFFGYVGSDQLTIPSHRFSWLTLVSVIVFCIGVPFIFLYGLSHVSVVRSITATSLKDAKSKPQAPKLYPLGDMRSVVDARCFDCTYHNPDALLIRRFCGSTYASSCLDRDRYRKPQLIQIPSS